MKWKCTTSLLSVPVAAAVMWMGMDVTSVATAAGQSATKQSIPVSAGESAIPTQAQRNAGTNQTLQPTRQAGGGQIQMMRQASNAQNGTVAGGLIEQVVVDGVTVGPLQGGQQQLVQVTLDANPDPVIGFRIEADVSGITGNGTWASDMQLRITPPGGVGTYQIGGVPADDGGTLTNEWIFQGSVSDEDGFYSDTLVNIWNEISKGGTWRFTFRNDWPDSTADMVWDNVVITLLKGETVVVECPVGGIDEPGECTDGLPIENDPNGGCNADPAVFTQVQCGDTICGDIWASADTGTRDVDWYEVTVASSQSLTWTVQAEFPSTALIVNGDCDNAVGIAAIEQPFVEYDVTACVEPGTYYLIVTTNAIFEGITCDGLGDFGNAYTATLSCAACDASQFGACCFGETSSCDDGRTAIGCAVDGGVYAGDESLCSDPETCPEGACCTLGTFESAPQCSVKAQLECELEGNTYQGDNTTCDVDPKTGLPGCPRGACCFADGTCGFGSVDLCIQSGGAYNGHFPEDGGPACPGDFNGDGAVNVSDLLHMLGAFSPNCPGCPEDLNGDGAVNVSDLLQLLGLFTPSCPQGGGAGACAEVDCRDCELGGIVWDSTDPCDELVGEGTNGGCNFDPPVFEQLCCGDAVSGTIWSQLEDPQQPQSPDNRGRRDLDWYVLEVDVPTRVILQLQHDFHNITVDEDGNPDPGGFPLEGSILLGFGDSCDPVSIFDTARDTDDGFDTVPGVTNMVNDLEPGSYYVIVTAQLTDFFTDELGFPGVLPCDSGNNGYTLTIDCIDLIFGLCEDNCNGIANHPGFPDDLCFCDSFCFANENCCPGVCADCSHLGDPNEPAGPFGFCFPACTYLLDTEILNSGIGLNNPNTAIMWLQRFDSGAEGDTLTAIRTSYAAFAGGIVAGQPVGFAVYDANPDGTPGALLHAGESTVSGDAFDADAMALRQEFALPDIEVTGEFYVAAWTQGLFPAPANAGGFSDLVADGVWIAAEAAGFAAVDPANIDAMSFPPTILVDANPALEFVWLLCARGQFE